MQLEVLNVLVATPEELYADYMDFSYGTIIIAVQSLDFELPEEEAPKGDAAKGGASKGGEANEDATNNTSNLVIYF